MHRAKNITLTAIRFRCIDIDATSAPRKRCFCRMGFFGDGCSKPSALNAKISDGVLESSAYQKRALKESGNMYWKILEDSNEIEVVLKMKTASYAAVGWKPSDIEKSCQAFPTLVGKYVSGEAEAEGEAEGEAEAEAEGAAAEGEAESEAEAEAESEACPNNTFKYPEGCEKKECSYFAKWNRDGDYVQFTVKHKIGEGQWTAVGFSENPFMVSSHGAIWI